MIEKGEKPPYEEFIKFMKGEIDPPIDAETTKSLINQRTEEGRLSKKGFDIIICSPALRARQTSELIKKTIANPVPVHVSKYLREVNIPMDDITPEFYMQAKDIHEVRQKFMDSFLAGEKIDEDVIEVYRRAERFLTYFRRIRKWTGKTPLFISHGIFPRFLNLAIKHQGEDLDNDKIRIMVREEFAKTSRPGTLRGFRLSIFETGEKILGLT